MRFSLGLLFNTSAKYAGKELNTSANNDETSAKSAYSTSHSGRDTKNSTNISTKGFEWVGKWVEPNPAQVNRIRLIAD